MHEFEGLITEIADCLKQKELIQACLNGDRKAQKSLYELYSAKMYAVCLRYAVDENEASDMLQEGFIRIYTNLDQFEGKGSFEGWIRRVFIHTAIKYYHKMRRHNSTDEIGQRAERATGESVVGRMSADELMQLIKELPEGYRVVFNLYAVEGYSHKEIADLLNIGESTSRSQLVKARRLLQERVNVMQNHLV